MSNRLRRNPARLPGGALFQEEPVKDGGFPFGPRHYSLLGSSRVNRGLDAILGLSVSLGQFVRNANLSWIARGRAFKTYKTRF